MKIYLLIHDLRAGGAECVAATLVNELVARGHSVRIGTYTSNPDFFSLDQRVERERLSFRASESRGGRSRGRLSRSIEFFKRFPIIRNAVHAYEPDIVISFQTKANIYTIISLLYSKIPVIVSEHSYRWAGSLSRTTDFFRRLLYPFAKAIVVLTDSDKGNYRGLRNMEVIPNPLAFSSIPLERPAKERIMLAVGRVVRLKGFDLLIRAIATIDRDCLDGYKLLIVGEGEERENLQWLAQDLEIADYVSFEGQQKDIESYFSRAGIFVLSSRFEGFSMVLIEAMARGCAIAAFDCPVGPREILKDGYDGILVPAGDADALGTAIRRLILDPDEAERLGTNALASVGRFSASSITDRWIKLIQAACST